MKRAQWRDRVGLPALLLSALMSTAVTSAAIPAGLMPAVASAADCSTVTPALAGRGAAVGGDGRNRWASVSAQLGKRGELTGRALSARTVGGALINVALPNESYVAPVEGDVVVYARDLSVASEVRALSLTTGCDVRLATTNEVVRSAVLDSTGAFLYVHRVMRSGRADAGITRYDLASGMSSIVVPPLKTVGDKGIGLIFGTELRWSVDGSRLAVQSCGFSSCLTRVLDVTTGNVTAYDASGQGTFVALTSEHLVTLGDCLGLPCAVQSTQLDTGAVTTLADEAFGATFAAAPDGHSGTVVIQTSAGDEEVEQ